MDCYIEFEKKLINPYRNSFPFNESDPIASLLNQTSIGNYVEVLKDDLSRRILPIHIPSDLDGNLTDFVQSQFSHFLDSSPNGEYVVFCIGIACLQLFTQNNFCGPFIGPEAQTTLYTCDNNIEILGKVNEELLLDAEGIYSLLYGPEYLLFARVIFQELQSRSHINHCKFIAWWFLRYNFVHQKVTDEKSPIIHNSICELYEEMEKYLSNSEEKDLVCLFNLEMCLIHLFYYESNKARICLQNSKTILGVNINLSGALGKRTKWQQTSIPQLLVKIEYEGSPVTENEQEKICFLPTDLPKDVLLNDDTRLNKIKFEDVDEDSVPSLTPIEQSCLLAQFSVKSKSSAQDINLVEEKKAYLRSLLQNSINWSIQLNALLSRSLIEISEPRATERSLLQVVELVEALQREEPSRFERLKLIYTTDLIPQWSINQELARIYMRTGCLKTAVDMFERLHLWDDVIMCYNELQMRHKSAEVIRELLAKEETPKLLCLLGEATDDIDCFLKAWEKSDHKSARAQRCLGNHYYVNKDYKKAIEHYEISVKINYLEFPVWQRLAFSALQAQEWRKCVVAYKQCCTLEPDSFECWNNISQAYLNLQEQEQAWKTLKEAVRCNDSKSWRLLENFLLVSTSLGYVGEALNTYVRLLQIKENYVDTEILGRIVKMVIEDLQSDSPFAKKRCDSCQELLGNLAQRKSNGELWFLRADLIYNRKENNWQQHSLDYYKKAVAASTQKFDWARDVIEASMTIMRCMKLLEVFAELIQSEDKKFLFNTYFPSINIQTSTVISHIKKFHTDYITNELIAKFQEPIHDLKEKLDILKSINADIKS